VTGTTRYDRRRSHFEVSANEVVPPAQHALNARRRLVVFLPARHGVFQPALLRRPLLEQACAARRPALSSRGVGALLRAPIASRLYGARRAQQLVGLNRAHRGSAPPAAPRRS
jgi:hypothetical protein